MLRKSEKSFKMGLKPTAVLLLYAWIIIIIIFLKKSCKYKNIKKMCLRREDEIKHNMWEELENK